MNLPLEPYADERAISARRARLEAQLVLIERQTHPLTLRALAGRADLDASPDDPDPLPNRCSSCDALERGRWLKCSRGPNNHKPDTDVEPWWPACILYRSNGAT